MSTENTPQQPIAEQFDYVVMERGTSFKEAFEFLASDVRDYIAKKLKEGVYMRPQGSPIIYKDDNFYKAVQAVTEVRMPMLFISGMAGGPEGIQCDHKDGYEQTQNGLVCKKCGEPLC